MSDEEASLRVHPLRHVSVFIYAILISMDIFFRGFSTSILFRKLDPETVFSVFSLIGTVYGVATFFAGLFWGWMADKYGRKPPLILSGIITIPALLLFAFAAEPWHFLVAYTVNGIGGSAGFMITRVLVADLAPRKALGERIAALSMLTSVVPLISFWFGGFHLYNIDYRLPLIVAAMSEAAALPLAYFVIPETLVERNPPTEVKGIEERKPSRTNRFVSGAREWGLALTRRGAALYLFAMSVGSMMGTAASTIVLPLFESNLGFTATHISLVYTFGTIVPLLLVPGGILSDIIGRKWPVLFAGFWGALVWPLYTLLPGMDNPFSGFLLINLVNYAASIVAGPAFLAYFFEWIPNRGRGRASAIAEIFQSLTTIVLLPLVGGIIEELRPESVFYFAAVFGILVYAIVWIAWKETPLPKEKWKMRKSTTALIAAEIMLVALVIIFWLFQFSNVLFSQ